MQKNFGKPIQSTTSLETTVVIFHILVFIFDFCFDFNFSKFFIFLL